VVSRSLSVFLLSVLVTGATWVSATTELRWDPRWSSVPFGDTGTVSVILDEPLPMRTIEVFVTYDSTLISGLSGEPGSVFDGVPCFLFEDFGITSPGVWHGLVVIIGGACQTTGPGELLVLNFTAGSNQGICHLTTVDVKLFTPEATLYPEVSLSSAYVIIGPESTDVPAAPAVGFSLSPNPFNPIVNLDVELANSMAATLSVFDPRGHRVAQPWSGILPSGRSSVSWQGLASSGAALPSGTYLFVLELPGREPMSVNGTLIR